MSMNVEANAHAAQAGEVARLPGRWTVWGGRILSALPVLAMLASASLKLARPPQVMDVFVGRLGYREGTLAAIAVLEIGCALLYAIPRTSVLGAVLLTGFLGGAIATHVRVGDPFAPPLVLGILAWAGLYLRETRLRALIPLRTRS
jgi:DoxX-like protein